MFIASGYYLVIILSLAILTVMTLTIKFKIHPFIALLFASFFVAFTLNIPVYGHGNMNYAIEVASLIGKGFGYSLSNVGVIIVLGSIIGTILEMSGAALKMGEVAIKILGRIHPALAMNALGFIVSIPVFCDSGYLILTPLRKAVAKKTHVSPIALSVALSTGLYASHVLIPPTPAPAAAVLQFNLEPYLLSVIGIALLVSIPASLAGCLYGIFISKYIKKPEYKTKPISYETLITELGDMPPAWKSFLPVIVPIVLMALGSFIRFYGAPFGVVAIHNIFVFLGDPSMALFVGFLCSLLLVNRFDKSSLSHWIGDGIHASGNILAIAGASGAFAEVLKATNLTSYLSNLGHFFVSSNLGLILPFLIASLVKISLGSSTIAIVTVSSLFAPMLYQFGFITPMSKIFLMMAIGSGAMIASHANDSYFWIVVELSGLSVHDAYKARTLATIVQGITAMSVVLILSSIML